MRAAQPGRSGRPVCLFSSGPPGTGAEDAKGRDLRSAAEPREIPGFTKAIRPRGHHVFFGALDSRGLTLAERSAGKLPGGAAGLPERGFRDWAEIKDWADGIASDLSAA